MPIIKMTREEYQKKYGEAPNIPKSSSSSIGGDISSSFNSGVDQIKKGFNQASFDNQNNTPLTAIEGGLNIAAGSINAAFSPLAPLLKPINKAVESVVKPVSDKISDIPAIQKFATSKAGQNVERAAEDIANIATIAGTVAGGKQGGKVLDKTISTIDDAAENLTKVTSNIKEKVSNFSEKITQPDVSEATKVSLNPTEALKNTGQDIKVSVGGKLKNLSEITPSENTKIKTSTTKALDTFTKQAEKFSKDRSAVGGSPVEIVGSRADSALQFADKKRQTIGKKMGEIELKYVDDQLPISENTIKPFVDVINNFENPKFGIDTANAPIVRKLVEDFDKLGTNGATIGERLDFVRSWDRYLNDAKDAFGNFKENSTVNTRIQNAVKTLKNETVDSIATKDKVYKNLRSKYSTFKKLDEIGNSLLGKDGALGERIKGAALIKRAIQSNSDAGARQFLVKLRELTGYDAIKEGDLALTAMESVGDYQGLSLLNIINKGKSGAAQALLEKGQDLIVGNKATRVKRYINK